MNRLGILLTWCQSQQGTLITLLLLTSAFSMYISACASGFIPEKLHVPVVFQDLDLTTATNNANGHSGEKMMSSI